MACFPARDSCLGEFVPKVASDEPDWLGVDVKDIHPGGFDGCLPPIMSAGTPVADCRTTTHQHWSSADQALRWFREAEATLNFKPLLPGNYDVYWTVSTKWWRNGAVLWTHSDTRQTVFHKVDFSDGLAGTNLVSDLVKPFHESAFDWGFTFGIGQGNVYPGSDLGYQIEARFTVMVVHKESNGSLGVFESPPCSTVRFSDP